MLVALRSALLAIVAALLAIAALVLLRLLTVAADRLSFYEARAVPAGSLKRTKDSVSGDFNFTGEGETWKRYQVLELQDSKLVRTESGPMASYTYARCA